MSSGKNRQRLISSASGILAMCIIGAPGLGFAADAKGLWPVYDQVFKGAKYVDLTHTITPKIPVWAGFAASTFAPAKAGADIEVLRVAVRAHPGSR
jgi:hypothetical protein